ncbi:peptide chain release factor N(5)-glutamine methyltransferase [Robbsia sp. KACC 23696]|uniref:peptide chain release factor N(5)-glutamine methyltransferase n=1 Tax=Robbsia sp. KACC 23696 TaxID=3149231 RepID=UPI00325BB6CD
MSVARALREAGLDALDARVLLCHALNWPRSSLITRADEPLDATQPDALRTFLTLAARRRAGEPVAQLVGKREFYGRDFQVTPDVLIPRPDTELLVEQAIAIVDAFRSQAGSDRGPMRVLDLGTGSGAIAVTLAAERPGIEVVATDRSLAALQVARANADALLDGRTMHAIRFLAGDWFEALSTAQLAPASFDLIVSNPPYIHRDDAHLSEGDLRFEPRGALTDEADGLGPIRILTSQATHWLRHAVGAPHPALLVEHGYDQGAAARALFHDAGWCDMQTTRDLGGQERVTGGRWPNR